MSEDGEHITLTRKELYDLVWSTPIVQIIKKFGVSDVGFAKWCRKMDVPRPGRGYWRKLECGKKVKRTPLRNPEREDTLSLYVIKEDSKTQQEPEEIPESVAFERCPENKIIVPLELNAPHPYIVQAKKALGRGREDDKYSRIIPSSKPCLNISVCRDSLDRALRIMDTIIKALESRGIVFKPREDGFKADIDGELFSICIEERLMMGETGEIGWRGKPEIGYFPTGNLTLIVHGDYYLCQRKWNDGKKQRVEDRLNDMVISLHRLSAMSKRKRLEREKRAEEYAEKQRKIQEIREQQRLEKEKIQQLEGWVSSWNKAQDIRRFISALIECHEEIQEGSEMAQLIRWALQQADRYDPLVESPPSVLDQNVPLY